MRHPALCLASLGRGRRRPLRRGPRRPAAQNSRLTSNQHVSPAHSTTTWARATCACIPGSSRSRARRPRARLPRPPRPRRHEGLGAPCPAARRPRRPSSPLNEKTDPPAMCSRSTRPLAGITAKANPAQRSLLHPAHNTARPRARSRGLSLERATQPPGAGASHGRPPGARRQAPAPSAGRPRITRKWRRRRRAQSVTAAAQPASRARACPVARPNAFASRRSRTGRPLPARPPAQAPCPAPPRQPSDSRDAEQPAAAAAAAPASAVASAHRTAQRPSAPPLHCPPARCVRLALLTSPRLVCAC